MDFQDLLTKFKELLSTIQLLVNDSKAEKKVEPAIRLVARWKTDEFTTTETDVQPSRTHLEYIEKKESFIAKQLVLDPLKTHQSYSEFHELLAVVSQARGGAA